MPERINIPEHELRDIVGILTYEEIGNIYGCSKATVSTRVSEYGLNDELPIRSLIHTGKKSWHRGLSKDDDPRMANLAKAISKALTGKKKSKEHLENWRKARMNHPVSEETREKMSRAHKGIPSMKKGKTYLEMYGEEKANEITKKWFETCQASPNNAEKQLQDILNNLYPDNWMFVGDGKFLIGGLCPDFKHYKDKLLIELFGDYWHSKTDIEIRGRHFKVFGYKTIFIWEHELSDEYLINSRIQEVIK